MDIKRIVIDSNMLRDPTLEKYLKASDRNYAVLCDYVMMEAYKAQDAVQSILASMEILSRYPNQVFALKNTSQICGLSGRSKGLQKRLISEKQTKEFKNSFKNINILKNNLKAESSINELSQAARAHLDLLENEYKDLPQQFYELGSGPINRIH